MEEGMVCTLMLITSLWYCINFLLVLTRLTVDVRSVALRAVGHQGLGGGATSNSPTWEHVVTSAAAGPLH